MPIPNVNLKFIHRPDVCYRHRHSNNPNVRHISLGRSLLTVPRASFLDTIVYQSEIIGKTLGVFVLIASSLNYLYYNDVNTKIKNQMNMDMKGKRDVQDNKADKSS